MFPYPPARSQYSVLIRVRGPEKLACTYPILFLGIPAHSIIVATCDGHPCLVTNSCGRCQYRGANYFRGFFFGRPKLGGGEILVLLLRNEGKIWYKAPCCCILVDGCAVRDMWKPLVAEKIFHPARSMRQKMGSGPKTGWSSGHSAGPGNAKNWWSWIQTPLWWVL